MYILHKQFMHDITDFSKSFMHYLWQCAHEIFSKA